MPMHTNDHGAIYGVPMHPILEVILRFEGNTHVPVWMVTHVYGMRNNGRHLFSVFEFLNMAYGDGGEKPSGVAVEWHHLTSSGLKNEIRQMEVDGDLAKMYDVKFKKHSSNKSILVSQPVMTVKGLQWLLAQLGTGVDENFRLVIGSVLTRYMAGDRDMIVAGARRERKMARARRTSRLRRLSASVPARR